MINFFKNNHGDTLTSTVVVGGIILVVTFMVMIGAAINTDNVSEEKALVLTSDFINTCANEGKITESNYDTFQQSLNNTGHTYKIEIEVKHLDENIGNKSSWTSSSVIGENSYYSVYTSQISDELAKNGKYLMKEGDIISVTVKNTDESFLQEMESAIYTGLGKGTAVKQANGSATVKVNGK
ncbi:MAG: hypothetical protein IKG42_01790 [Clostridia bacterium]|nr:hypothetical protein [Clostridia bacterium]